MPVFSTIPDLASIRPTSLWEAVALLARIQDELAAALREQDLAALRHLRSDQAVAWAFIRGFAEQLVARGEAPPGMVQRLRRALRLHEVREAELREAAGLSEKPLPLAA